MAVSRKVQDMRKRADELDAKGYSAAAELMRLEAGAEALKYSFANGEISRGKGRQKKPKYGNKTSHRDGHKFDSQAELRRYITLKHLLNVGEIDWLDAKPQAIELMPKAKDEHGKTIRAITYAPDFIYAIDGVVHIEDVKGMETAVFRLKWNMVRRHYAERAKIEGVQYKLVIMPSDQC